MSDKTQGLGRVIRALRKLQGMSQAELAERTGILTRTSIVNIEGGRQTLNVNTVNAIARAMGYEVRIKFVRHVPGETPVNYE